jgi:hypothetical protein
MYQALDDLVLDFISTAEHIGEMVDTSGSLPDYPLVDQLHEPTSDGLADENARFNCVFASYAGSVRYLCRPNHQDANGDFIKDQSPPYGQGYTGGAAAELIAPTVERLYGIHTNVQHSADRTQLLAWCIANINLGHPTMITMPSAWNSQPDKVGYNPNSPNFPTHAGMAFGYNPATKELLVANPWGGFVHRGTYDYWVRRFCYQKTYDLSLIGAGPMPLPAGWKDANNTLSNTQNGFVVVKGFRDLILNAPYWDPADVPLGNEHLLTADEVLELSNPSYGKDDKTRVQQRFRMSWLAAREGQDGIWRTGKEWVGVEADFLRHEVDRLNALLAAVPPVTPPHVITSQEAYDKVGQDLKDAGKIQ